MIDLTGDWRVTITVTRESPPLCSGEAGQPYGRDVRIDQTGNSVSMSGLGTGFDPWEGEVDPETRTFTFGGDKQDGSGITSATFELTIAPDQQSMAGQEFWSWSGPGGTCPNGESDVTAVRVG